MADTPTISPDGDRLAKVIARAGLCSRRDAELWIKDGRVAVNGKVVKTPAFNVTEKDRIKVDGEPLAARQGTRVWLYHKPAGLVVTEKDPEGRETIFERLEAEGLPRVVSIGRLDINTEGLLLLTNDGGLKRVLELPATGWLRRYRVRAFGTVTQAQLDPLKEGIEVDGVNYGPIEAVLERQQGANTWLVVSLREGKNREVKNVLAALGLQVNRLIRVSYGPFQLGEISIGGIEVVKARVLREQLGKRLAEEAGADFDSDLPENAEQRKRSRLTANPSLRAAAPGQEAPQQRREKRDVGAQFRFTDRAEKSSHGVQREEDRPPRKDRPGRGDGRPARPARPPRREIEDEGPARQIHFDDGREPAEFKEKHYGKKPKDDAAAGASRGVARSFAPRGDGPRPSREGGDKRPGRNFSERPKRDFGDRPKRAFGDRPPRSDFGDRPKRPFGGARSEGGADRPARDFGDRPKRDFGDRPKRDFGDRPKRDFGDRPKRSFGGSRPEGGAERPKRPYGDRPPRAAGAEDRPKRSFGSRPPRAGGDAERRPFNPDRPRPERPSGGRPQGNRPEGGRPRRPGGSRPAGDRPRGPRPGGARPSGPRKPPRG